MNDIDSIIEVCTYVQLPAGFCAYKESLSDLRKLLLFGISEAKVNNNLVFEWSLDGDRGADVRLKMLVMDHGLGADGLRGRPHGSETHV